MAQTTRGRFPNYWCQITCPTHSIDIIADLPESFGLSMTGHYDGSTGTLSGAINSVAGALPFVGQGVSTAAGAAFNAVGSDVAFQALTKRIWRGSEPLDFSLALLFDAEENTYEDVHEACTLLSSLALPDYGGGAGGIAQSILGRLADLPGGIVRAANATLGGGVAMHSPNPSRLSEYNRVDVRLGRMWLIENVTVLGAELIEDVNRLGLEGYPLAGGVTLRLSTETVWTKENLWKAAGVRNNARQNAPTRANSERQRASLSPVQRMSQNR